MKVKGNRVGVGRPRVSFTSNRYLNISPSIKFSASIAFVIFVVFIQLPNKAKKNYTKNKVCDRSHKQSATHRGDLKQNKRKDGDTHSREPGSIKFTCKVKNKDSTVTLLCSKFATLLTLNMPHVTIGLIRQVSSTEGTLNPENVAI